MIAVDTTVVNLALPLIGRGLHAPVAGLQWTIAAYTITTASLMLTSGSIGDRFGRRTVLQAGLTVFTSRLSGAASPRTWAGWCRMSCGSWSVRIARTRTVVVFAQAGYRMGPWV